MEEALFDDNIFSIVPTPARKEHQKILSIVSGPIEHLLGLRQCNAMYEQVKSQSDSHLFMRDVLCRMQVRPLVKPEDLENIPKKGPAVVVGNHPFGGIEGILMAELLLSCRPDVKIMANALLNRIPQLRKLTIPVDPFSRSGSTRVNVGPMRAALRWLKNGVCCSRFRPVRFRT